MRGLLAGCGAGAVEQNCSPATVDLERESGLQRGRRVPADGREMIGQVHQGEKLDLALLQQREARFDDRPVRRN
jgi:hypothetical protein